MQTVYRTLDGQIFTEPADAEKHERFINGIVKMYNRRGDRAYDTSMCVVVQLIGPEAAGVFRKMIESNPEDYILEDFECQICEEDTGFFYWDDMAERFRWIDDDIVNALIAATHQITE